MPKQREVPCNISAEKYILGAILMDNADLPKASILAPEDFSLDSHQRVYRAFLTMAEEDIGIDHVTVAEALGTALDSVGGMPYLRDLTLGMPRRPAVKEYVRIVKAKSFHRQLIRCCDSAITKTFAGESGFDIIACLRSQLDEIEESARNGVRKASLALVAQI
jgi:replicative DNA helicase